MNTTLKIIEWNVQSVDVRNEKKFKTLIKEIVNQKADIVVLTEITCAQKEVLSCLLENSECNYAFAATSNQTPNGVNIIVSADKVEKVMFQDIRTYKNSRKNEVEVIERTVYPDALLATVYLKNGIKFCLMGTRFSVSNLRRAEYEAQIKNFYDIVNGYKARLVVGDFNWDTAIKSYVESNKSCDNEEEKFCSKIGFNGSRIEGTRKAKFEMWPQPHVSETEKEALCSHIAKKDGKSKTCPDRVVYDNNTVELKCSYYPNLHKEKWLFDHAILICEVEIKN